ncbi:MAG TPA: nucleotidyltransferase domain-containing protein [Balneolaceae bacterium]
MAFGLTEKQINQVKGELTEHPEITKVLIFGSRAKGTQREGSDIDLALVGESISHKALLNLKSGLNNLELPFIFDTVIYSDIKEDALKDHIDRVGIVFYEKTEC